MFAIKFCLEFLYIFVTQIQDFPFKFLSLTKVHTGLLMSLIDSATTTLAICSGPQMAGITMDLSISNFEQINPSETPQLLLLTKMKSIKETTCYITCDILSPDEKILFATGRQTKFYHPKSRQPLRYVDLNAENLVLP